MKMLFRAAAALLVAFCLHVSAAHAQCQFALAQCAPGVDCTTGGTANTGTGQPLYYVGAEYNANFSALGTALSVTGVTYSEGNCVQRAATGADLVTLLSGGSIPAQLQAILTAATAQVISYTATAATIYDFSPSGWAGTVAVVYIVPNTGGTTICGIVQNSSTTPMQAVYFINASTAGDPLYFQPNCSGESTAANKLAAAATLLAIPSAGFMSFYDSTTQNRWVFP